MDTNLANLIDDYKKNKEEGQQEDSTTTQEESVKTEAKEAETTQNTATETETKVEETKEEETKDITVNLTDLFTWIENHLPGLESHSKVKLQVAGVDEDTVIIKCPKIGTEGTSKKDLFLIKDCKHIIVPDVPVVDLTIFKNNTMKFISELLIEDHPNIYMKSYILGSGIINYFCVSINDILIPYDHLTVKRSKKDFVVPVKYKGDISKADSLFEVLNKAPDFEAIELMYKQFGKVKDKLTTKLDIIGWLIKRQDESIDINHHLIIDKLLLSILEIS